MERALPQASQARSPAAVSGRAEERGAPARRLAAQRERAQVAKAAPWQEFWEQQPAPFFQMAQAQGLVPAKAPAARELAGAVPEEPAQVEVLVSSSRR